LVMGYSILRQRITLLSMWPLAARGQKGMRLYSSSWTGITYGNISEPGDIGGNPRKSCLFFLTVSAALKWDYPELRLNGRKSTSPYEVSGAFSTIREKPGKRFIARQVVPITATGLQGE